MPTATEKKCECGTAQSNGKIWLYTILVFHIGCQVIFNSAYVLKRDVLDNGP